VSGLYAEAGLFAGTIDTRISMTNGSELWRCGLPAILAGEIGWRTRRAAGCCPGSTRPLSLQLRQHDPFSTASWRKETIHLRDASQTLHYLDAEKTRTGTRVSRSAAAPGTATATVEATAIVRVVGPCAARPKDEAGIGFIISNFSNDFAVGAIDNGSRTSMARRKTIEVSYKAMIGRWLALQPDVAISSSTRSETAAATWR